jgi:hypothetical protein
MYRHGSTCLEGPVTKSRTWWLPVEEPAEAPPHEADPDIRHDLVARVRRAIAAGEYDTPEKMEIALARFLQSLESA